MTAYALVTGTLFRAPNSAPQRLATHYVTATIKAKDGDAFQFWRVTAFSESVQSELMRLTEGDALSVQGALKVEEYEKDGQKRVSLGVIADHVLALRQPPKPYRQDKCTPATIAKFDAGDALR